MWLFPLRTILFLCLLFHAKSAAILVSRSFKIWLHSWSKMDRILEFYLNNAISEDAFTQWLQGGCLSTSANTNCDLTNLPDLTVNLFIDQFIDNLHQSFDWITKQTSNVPLNRSKNTTNPFIDENKVNLVVYHLGYLNCCSCCCSNL